MCDACVRVVGEQAVVGAVSKMGLDITRAALLQVQHRSPLAPSKTMIACLLLRLLLLMLSAVAVALAVASAF
eukprot:3871568-Rhodomonas_salina.1